MSQHHPRRPVPQSELIARLKSHAAGGMQQTDEAGTAVAVAAAPPRVRRDGWTVPKQAAFLQMLASTGSISEACASVGMSAESARRLRNHPGAGAFAEAWAQAIMVCVDDARQHAFDRALNGVATPVFRKGEYLGEKTVHSERMLMFVLRNYDLNVTEMATAKPRRRFLKTLAELTDLPDSGPPIFAE